MRARRFLAVLLAVGLAPAASAQTPPSPPPPPYSLPWLLRPAAAGTVVRLDSTLALYEDAATGSGGHTLVESFVASYRLAPRWAPLFRVSWVRNRAPEGTAERSGSAFSNPLLGASYVRPLPRQWRLSVFGASTVPIGGGGGDAPDAGAAAAMARAIPARSAMDNALFAVNYWTVIGGIGAARVTPGLTLQAEATVLQLTRVRGPRAQDGSRTNLTVGLHAGRFLTPRFSVGGELRMQRWLTDAAPVRANPRARETLTAALGPRLHLKAGRHWIRPGLSYTRALDQPLKGQGYDMLQLDVPVAF
ncbi:MAG TPA: hypothetical protein VFO85_02840 [Vicinamibacteria bacterium]|nr:hypothetical protein [Vicinamibacteria bacterium]